MRHLSLPGERVELPDQSFGKDTSIIGRERGRDCGW
jgi:hypothetical protein